MYDGAGPAEKTCTNGSDHVIEYKNSNKRGVRMKRNKIRLLSSEV